MVSPARVSSSTSCTTAVVLTGEEELGDNRSGGSLGDVVGLEQA